MYLSTEICLECGKLTMHHNNKCVECYDKEQKVLFEKWHKMTMQDQINELKKRIEKLEQGPMRF